MKKSLFAIAIMFAVSSCYAAEKEKVCIKNSQGKEVCKVIKVHKKLEGTKVPEKK